MSVGGPSEDGRRRETRWISTLFAIGAACFAIASIPPLAEVVPAGAIGATYFVGSIFFTTAALIVGATVWRDARTQDAPRSRFPALRTIDWWAAVIQFTGTVWFNFNTFHAMQAGMTTQQMNFRVWTPDFLGSVCFLVSSYLSYLAVCRCPWCVERSSRAWRIAALNLLGSVFFMLAAIAAFTLPSTGDLLDASVADTGTLLGAACFFAGAILLRPARAASGQATHALADELPS